MAEVYENHEVGEGKEIIEDSTSPPSASTSKPSTTLEHSNQHNHTTQAQAHTQIYTRTHIIVPEELPAAPITQFTPSHTQVLSLGLYPSFLIMDTYIHNTPESPALGPTLAQGLLFTPTYNPNSNSFDMHTNSPFPSSPAFLSNRTHALLPQSSITTNNITTYPNLNNSPTPNHVRISSNTGQSQLTTYLQQTLKENLPFSEWVGAQGCPDTKFLRMERL